jgi:hypothetical protein
MNTKEAIEKGAKLNDISIHILFLEIPGYEDEVDKIEIRRSFGADAAFIIVEKDGIEVVDQDDKSEWLKRFCERLFLAFGSYKPVIMWASELDEYFYNRVRETDIDILKRWQDEDPKEDKFSDGLGALFG